MTKIEREIGKVSYIDSKLRKVDTKGLEKLSEKELKQKIKKFERLLIKKLKKSNHK